MDRTSAVVKMDSLAPSGPTTAGVERPTPSARRLAEASLSPNTRRAYSGALRRLAAYLAELHDLGRACSAERGGSRRRRMGHRPPVGPDRRASEQPSLEFNRSGN